MAEELAEEAVAGAAVTWEVWEVGTVEVGARVAAAGKEAGKAGLVGEEGWG